MAFNGRCGGSGYYEHDEAKEYYSQQSGGYSRPGQIMPHRRRPMGGGAGGYSASVVECDSYSASAGGYNQRPVPYGGSGCNAAGQGYGWSEKQESCFELENGGCRRMGHSQHRRRRVTKRSESGRYFSESESCSDSD